MPPSHKEIAPVLSEAQFNRLFYALESSLVHIILRCRIRRQDVPDVLQEVALHAWEDREHFDATEPLSLQERFSDWLAPFVRHAIDTHLRTCHRLPSTISILSLIDEPCDNEQEALWHTYQQAVREAMEADLLKLNAREKRSVSFWLTGISLRGIEIETGIPKSTAWRHVKKAIRRLNHDTGCGRIAILETLIEDTDAKDASIYTPCPNVGAQLSIEHLAALEKEDRKNAAYCKRHRGEGGNE